MLIKLIKEQMERMGIKTGAQLSRLTGLNKTSIWRVLKSPKQVSVENIYIILKSLDLLNEHENHSENTKRKMHAADGDPIDQRYSQENIKLMQEQLANYQELMRNYKDAAENYKKKLDQLKQSFLEGKRKEDDEQSEEHKKRQVVNGM